MRLPFAAGQSSFIVDSVKMQITLKLVRHLINNNNYHALALKISISHLGFADSPGHGHRGSKDVGVACVRVYKTGTGGHLEDSARGVIGEQVRGVANGCVEARKVGM